MNCVEFEPLECQKYQVKLLNCLHLRKSLLFKDESQLPVIENPLKKGQGSMMLINMSIRKSLQGTFVTIPDKIWSHKSL